jgi:ABC-type transport system involved in multi-copper enzyme maturation permease subunit
MMETAFGCKELSIGWASLLEAIRRKDIYVMLILSGIIIVVTGIFNAFGVPELRKFMMDVSLTIINVFTVIIAVLVSARQLPYELENRTLYPMLAKPVGRAQFLMGKFAGTVALSTIALLMFVGIAGIVFLSFGISLGGMFFQYIYLRWLSLFLICSMTLCLSLVLTHAANVTISLLLCMGASIFTRTVIIVHDSLNPWQQKLLSAAYWIFPHLDLFDVSQRVIHGWLPAPAWTLAAMTLYAMIYTVIFLGLGHLRFRRLPL